MPPKHLILKMMEKWWTCFWKSFLGILQPPRVSRTPAVPLGLCRVQFPTFSNYSSKMTGKSKPSLAIHFKNSSNFLNVLKFHIQVNKKEACGFSMHYKLF